MLIQRAAATSRSLVRCSASTVEQVRQHVVTTKSMRAQELVERYLDRAEQHNATLNSFISIDREGALQQVSTAPPSHPPPPPLTPSLPQAAAIDAKIAAGEPVGPLAGMPIAIKDNIATRGAPTTAGSRILAGYTPPYDATAVARLRAAGAVIVGKTNMDEFGMGSSTEASAYGAAVNPWGDGDRVPGGSSGGSAAAVAAGQCAAALGSDTGGSIRQPAHFCGVVGVKPTYGRVSRSGLVAYASSLDCIGPMARTVADAAALLTAIAGADPADATCARRPTEDFAAALPPAAALPSAPLAGRRLGLIRETTGAGVAPGVEAAVRAAAAHLESLGATVEEVSLPAFDAGLPAYYVLALSEASSNLSRYDGVRYGVRADAPDLRAMYGATRGAGLGPEVRRRILMGTYALSAGYYDAYYKRAQQVRTLVARGMAAALERCDALVCPAAPTTAYRLGEKSADPLAMYKGDLMTVNVNLAGLPAVVLPCGTDGDLPVGLQLIGRAFGEADLLGMAHVYEATAGTGVGAPPGFDWI